MNFNPSSQVALTANGPQVGGRFNAANLLLCAGLPPSETIGKRGFNNFPEHLFGQVVPMSIYLAIEQQQTPTTMSTKTDFNKSIFTCWTKAFQMNGEAAIEEQTFGDFLRECVEDPAAAWHIKEVDGAYEVRTNPHHQIYGNKLHGTFETYAEAEQFLLEGLEWDFNNKDYSGPSYDFDRAELVKFLTEEYSEA